MMLCSTGIYNWWCIFIWRSCWERINLSDWSVTGKLQYIIYSQDGTQLQKAAYLNCCHGDNSGR